MSDFPFSGGPDVPFSTSRLAILLTLAAVGYALSAYGMKLYTLVSGPPAIAMIGGGIALAVVCEVAILRRMDLSTGYVIIIAIETLLVLFAAIALGETLDARKIFGIALVVLGLALVH